MRTSVLFLPIYYVFYYISVSTPDPLCRLFLQAVQHLIQNPRGRLFAQQLSGEKAGYCIIDRERPDRADRSRTDRDLAMTEHMPDNYYQYYPLSVPGNSSHHLQRMGEFLLCYVKKYAQLELDYLRKKRSAIENCLQISEVSSGAEDLLKEQSPYRDLILPYYSNHSRNSEKLAAWAQAEYISNPDYPDGKKFHTKKGELVRSKSEVFIADALFTHRIPYRYEQKLDLGSAGYFFPDFTVCHPRYLKTIYWEHFGLMDSEDYAHKAYRKLDIYTLNGIIPTLNLITTFETKENPIDSYVIEKNIKDFFL